jgi:hypothetical protein
VPILDPLVANPVEWMVAPRTAKSCAFVGLDYQVTVGQSGVQ